MWYDCTMYHTDKRAGSSESPSRFTIQLGDRGRLVLPSAVRRRLGLEMGDRLVLTVESDGVLRLASLKRQIAETRGMYAHVAQGERLADELIEDRREEARREDED